MLLICSWNVRGLNDSTKRGLVKSVISELRESILCLQETKVSSISRSFLCSFASSAFDKCLIIPSVGASGGIATCCSSRIFGCSEVLVRDHSLTLRMKHYHSGHSFYISNVYGPPGWEGKDGFCRELVALKALCKGAWVMCDDFNLTRFQNERNGRCWSAQLMTMFSNTINELEMLDLPIANQSFTWLNMQSNPTLAKLDRFLISTDWDLHFPLTKVKALPRITSDHSSLLLVTQKSQTSKLFRFEKVWLTREDFNLLVPGWRNEIKPKQGSVLNFAAKLRHCRKRIQEWCASKFHNILASKRATAEEIQKLDLMEEQSGLAPRDQETRRKLKAQLRSIIGEEELLWKARAKQHWLKGGDGNTRFFHAMANGRHRVNRIEAIEEQGTRITREKDKSDYFYLKFKDRFAPDNQTPSSIGDWGDLFHDCSVLSSDSLTAPFTTDEIKKAIFQMNGDKAPGPDGFSMLFFHKFWTVIKEDLIKIFDDLFERSLNTGPIDYSHICLVPKSEGATTANDNRPICLINCVQKIISMVLVNRLVGEMHKIISPSHFLKGGFILDSYVTACELISWGVREHIECVGIKADFEKAFDRVN